MSRIYDNQPLSNLPVMNIEVKQWDIKQFTEGCGLLLEGCIQNRSHLAISETSKQKQHFYVLHIKLQRAHRRKFDSSGKEIEPNFSDTTKVSTGYLNSSYKTEAKGKTDYLTNEEARQIISKPELTAHTAKYGGPELVSLWMSSSQCVGVELEIGDTVRLKTRGDGPFVFSVVKMDQGSSTVSNYAGGEGVGASWTDKIMDMKSSQPADQDCQGVDDEEWDD